MPNTQPWSDLKAGQVILLMFQFIRYNLKLSTTLAALCETVSLSHRGSMLHYEILAASILP